VLAVPYSLWGAVGEADHIVFPVSVGHQICLFYTLIFVVAEQGHSHLPITHMIAEFQAKHLVALVVSAIPVSGGSFPSCHPIAWHIV
jgi:hypothetical protein